MDSQSDEPQPSTSTQIQENEKSEVSDREADENDDSMESAGVNKELTKLLTVEEFLIKSKTYMLEHEKNMFLDTIDSDCLVVSAK